MIRVLVVEDMRVLREAIVSLLEFESDVTVIGALATGAEVLDKARTLQPDVLLVDVRLPDVNGIDVAKGCREHLPDVKILLLTALDKPGIVREALQIGVHGFLPKSTSTADLVQAIRKVHGGERVVSVELISAALEKGANPLSDRERIVLTEHSTGRRAGAIAKELNLAEGTVRNHLTRAINKLSARNALDAVRIAERFGWL